jgi:RimJ/RimL family protein N-acetyltransferase
LIDRANGQAKDVALAVFKINTDARRFYERVGFIVEGETPTHFNMRLKRSDPTKCPKIRLASSPIHSTDVGQKGSENA